MTLTTKFKKDISILTDAINNDIFLDIKHPKLYKKICRHYQNEVYLDGEDPDRDYSLILECIRQDLENVMEVSWK